VRETASLRLGEGVRVVANSETVGLGDALLVRGAVRVGLSPEEVEEGVREVRGEREGAEEGVGAEEQVKAGTHRVSAMSPDWELRKFVLGGTPPNKFTQVKLMEPEPGRPLEGGVKSPAGGPVEGPHPDNAAGTHATPVETLKLT